jgi:Arc/MetJ-type ribon-helix-helix transcriptional regulator
VKVLELEVPDQVAEQIESLVEAGWFASAEEVVRFALSELLSQQRFRLQEEFQREDVRWAQSLKNDKG